MTEQLTIGHLYPTQVPLGTKRAGSASTLPVPARSFQSYLDDKVVRLSRHAEVRLKQRGIELKPEQWNKIESAVDRAAAKGAKDSLLIMNELAFIVDVKSRTIVTAMDGTQMKDNVFTQIDSAVFVT